MHEHTKWPACVACFLSLACAGVTAQGKERVPKDAGTKVATGPVWPAPPARARVRFVTSVDAPSDWGITRNWWGRMVDVLAGRQQTRLVRPTGVAARDGILYVADPGAQSLIIYDARRHQELRIGRLGDRVLVSPVAVAPGPAGSVYLADSWLRQVLQLDRDGSLLRVISDATVERPSSVVFDGQRGRLYVGDSRAHVVHVFDEGGRKVGQFGGLGAAPGQFNAPTHLALTRDGSVVVTDALNFRVEVFDADGRYRYSLGSIGDGAGDFAAPKGAAVDRNDCIYVADAMFDAIQVFDTQGQLLLGFGAQGTQAGQFWLPNGIFIEDGIKLYVADAYNRRIQVFELLSEPDEPGASTGGSPP